MATIRFEQLVEVYRSTRFAGEGSVSLLSVSSNAIADLIRQIDQDDEAAGDTGISLVDDLDKVQVGNDVRVNIQSPRTGLGVLARSIDGLIMSPGARLEEPPRYYIVDSSFANGQQSIPEDIAVYRTVIQLVKLFGRAATYVDGTKSELLYIKESRLTIPIIFGAADLQTLSKVDAVALLAQFNDDLHLDQKLEILFEAVFELCRGTPANARFSFALRNLGELDRELQKGYKLFASNFSYAKIRSELEDARIEYMQKIHKTVADIQSQLLGIPVATVIVASQMKPPTTCGAEIWVNAAILGGAWIFVVLLWIAIANQHETLKALKIEIERQRSGLTKDFPGVSDEFVGKFTSLEDRIKLHRGALFLIGFLGFIGALGATLFCNHFASMKAQACAGDSSPALSSSGRPDTKPAGDPSAPSLSIPVQGGPVMKAPSPPSPSLPASSTSPVSPRGSSGHDSSMDVAKP